MEGPCEKANYSSDLLVVIDKPRANGAELGRAVPLLRAAGVGEVTEQGRLGQSQGLLQNRAPESQLSS